MHTDVIVIGAGLSGLACALTLRDLGLDTLVVEAADAVGGRIRTDRRDGFLLDRAFRCCRPGTRRRDASWTMGGLICGPLNRGPWSAGTAARTGSAMSGAGPLGCRR